MEDQQKIQRRAYYNKLNWKELWVWLHPLSDEYQRLFVFEDSHNSWSSSPRTFSSSEDLETYVREHLPLSIHIKGLKQKTTHEIVRELVFDYDLNDKDQPFGPFQSASVPHMRVCCTQRKDICKTCWLFAAYAVEFLKILLPSMWGLDKEKIEVYFSGQKGIHIFVKDLQCFKWNQYVRTAILKTLSYPYFSQPQHKCYQMEVLPLAKKYTEAILKDARYQSLLPYVTQVMKDNPSLCYLAFMHFKLDEKVDLNHNIRMPLALHPKTDAIGIKLKTLEFPQVQDVLIY